MTTSAPAALSRGTMTLACSMMPGNLTLPSTLALSQIATPGVTRPRMPTLIALRVGQLDGLDDPRLEDGCAGVPVDRVGREQREVQLLLEGPQRVEAVVVLVVAEGGGVVADLVHRGGHRVRRAAGDRVDLGVVVRERRALDRVAGVDRQGALGTDLGADRLDDRGGLGDADVVVRLVVVLGVLEVVPVVDVAVQVGRAEHGQSHDLAVGARPGRPRRPARRHPRWRVRRPRRRRGPAAGDGWSRIRGGQGSRRCGRCSCRPSSVRCSIGAVPCPGARLAPEAQGRP